MRTPTNRRDFMRLGALATGFQEYKGRAESLPVSSETSRLVSVKGMLTVPTGPGLGVTIEPSFAAKAVRLA